jgi:hypothetical protein
LIERPRLPFSIYSISWGRLDMEPNGNKSEIKEKEKEEKVN